MNPLLRLKQFGQTIYLDEFRRSWLKNGKLQRLIDDDGVAGVTSNPSIFHKAIVDSNDYDDAIAVHARKGDTAKKTYEDLTVSDIANAADLFKPMFDASGGVDGMVSLEVSPELAHDEEGTVKEAHHLWDRLGHPNVFIKVPATDAGVPAIRRLIADGVNVNVTLLFGLPRYRQVADAFLSGLEERLAAGKSVDVHSVASFFLSRIDVMIDPQLDAMASQPVPQASAAHQLRGTAAVSSAKRAYVIYEGLFGAGGERFAKLAKAGARPQRLLWASTSTKDPAYPDTKYVESLIGRDTINTLPLKTIDDYRDHGDPAPRITDGADDALAMLQALTGVGVNLEAVVAKLEDEGVAKFIKANDELLATIESSLKAAPASS